MASLVSTARGRGRSRRRPRGLLARHRRVVAAHKARKARWRRQYQQPNTVTGWALSRSAVLAYKGGRGLYRLGNRASRAVGNRASRRIEAAIDKRTTYSADGHVFESKAAHDKYLAGVLRTAKTPSAYVAPNTPKAWVATSAQPPANYRRAEMSNQTTKQFVGSAEGMVQDLLQSVNYTDFLQKMTELHAMARRLDDVVSTSFANVAPAVNLDSRITKHVTEGAANGQLAAGLENACKSFRTLYHAQLEAEASSNVRPLNLPASTGKKAS